MATTIVNVTFNGITPVPRLEGGTENWSSGGFMGYYDAYEFDPADTLWAEVDLTGTGWRLAHLRFGDAAGTSQLTLNDLNGLAGRTIEYLALGWNSDVTLISTSVQQIVGFGGTLHDVTLGSGYTRSIGLYADRNVVTTGTGYVGAIETRGLRGEVTVNGDAGFVSLGSGNDLLRLNAGSVSSARTGVGNDTVLVQGTAALDLLQDGGGDNLVIVRGQARLSSLQLNDGDNTVAVQGPDARVNQISLNNGSNTLTTGGRYTEAVTSFDSSNVVTVGLGGIGSLHFNAQTQQAHRVLAFGDVASFRAIDRGDTAQDDQTTFATFRGSLDSGIFGSGNDVVTTVGNYAAFIDTRAGDDLVLLGSGGAGTVVLGGGNDTIRIRALDDGGIGTMVHGRAGVDTIDFIDIRTTGVTFSLNEGGAYQNIGTDDPDNLDPIIGTLAETSVETLRGTVMGDTFMGGFEANLIDGRAGDDEIMGANGNDTLVGGFGNDTLGGQNGDDTLNGGAGDDTLAGGAGADLLVGQAGADLGSGGDGNDTLYGGAGDDMLFGGAGNDRILGDAGMDRIGGGAGADVLFGGAEADIFVFEAGAGIDVVSDFEDGVDRFQIFAHLSGFAGLTITDSGANLRVDHESGSFFLLGQAGTVLTADDFLLD